MASFRRLEQDVARDSARVCVVGQGYVGLSLAAAAATGGMTVVGLDRDADLVADLAAGKDVVPGVSAPRVADAVATGRLTFTTDGAAVAAADVVVICVPTPLIDHRPDLSAIESAGRIVGEHLTPGTLVVLESTTYPGTTEQVLTPLLEVNGLEGGRDFLVAYSPERINPGDRSLGFAGVPRVVGGATPPATRAATAR